MKIATWNINSVRLRIKNIKELVDLHQPDIIALQETKVMDDLFPIQDLLDLGFKQVKFSGQKSYNGVAILSKLPIDESFSLEFYNDDKRHIAVKIGDIEIHNFYVPAGGDEPDPEINPKFKHKLAYLDEMHKWFKENRSPSDKIILVGDLNIAPHEHDVWSSKQLRNIVSHTDIEREKLIRNITDFNWCDVPRKDLPMTEKLYSWWSYRNRDWKKSNRGRRLDHIWATEPLASKAKFLGSIREFRDQESPSDHVPLIISL